MHVSASIVLTEPLPDDFREALQATAGRRGPFGDPVLFFTETGSTNDVAAAMAGRGAPEGAMVLALSQTAGRGRLGRTWWSPPGAGLYVSVVCRDRRVLPLLTLGGGVAVADGIRQSTGLPVNLKWPNDVVLSDSSAPGGRRKLAGILAEGTSGADGLQFVTLGIGVNVRPAACPPSLAARTTSLETELGRPVEMAPLLAEILAALNDQLTAVARGEAAGMLRRWRELAPSASGARVEWTGSGISRRGTTAGIDDQGALLVRTAGGTERIVSGELTWL